MELTLTESEFSLLRDLVHEVTGIKMADAKRQMLRTRLSKRLRALNLKSFKEYYDLLESQIPSGPEMTEFINAVTTNKTDFYREPHHFEFVRKQVIPEIERNQRTGTRQLRVWHAGCSTGEEPYTLAITLHECLTQPNLWSIRQLATDIDSCVLEHAIKGQYELDRLDPIPQSLKSRYFLKGKGEKSHLAQVKPELAEWLTFRRLNLLADPWPFSQSTQFDLIFCRNVMIYFDKPTQQRLVERFRQCLAPGGYLFIGHSESLFGISNGFSSLGKTIYKNDVQCEVAA